MTRAEYTTIMDISTNLQTINTLNDQQKTLTSTLTQKQTELTQTQAQLNQLQAGYDASVVDLAMTDMDLNNQETTKIHLETLLKPEAQLRSDTHPIAQNTALSDTTKTTLTQNALNTYDGNTAAQAMSTFSLRTLEAHTTNATFVPPTASEVQSTITLLTQELTRIQTQINTIAAQITAKQNEITTTQNSINTTQQSLDQSTAQLTQYMNDYIYWRDEYNRLANLRDTASSVLSSLSTTYANNRTRLINE